MVNLYNQYNMADGRNPGQVYPADITTGCVVYVAEVRSDGVMLVRSPGSSTLFLPTQDLRYDNRVPIAGEVKKGDMVIMNLLPNGSGKLVGSIVKTTDNNKIRGIVSAVIDDYLIVQYQNKDGKSEEELIQSYVVTNLKGDLNLGDEIELNMSGGKIIQAKMVERDQHEEIKEQMRKMHEEIPAPKLIEKLPEKISEPALIFKGKKDAEPDFKSFYENFPKPPSFEMGSQYVQRPIPKDIFQSEVLSSSYNPGVFPQPRSLDINTSNSEMNRVLDNYTIMLQHIKLLHSEIQKLANILSNQKRIEVINEVQKSWSKYVKVPQDSAYKYRLDEILKLQTEVSSSISGINPIFESQIMPNPPLVYQNYQPPSDSNFPYQRSFHEPVPKEVPLSIPAPINIPFSQQSFKLSYGQAGNLPGISPSVQTSIIIPPSGNLPGISPSVQASIIIPPSNELVPETPGRGPLVNFMHPSRPYTFFCGHSISQEALKNYLETSQMETINYEHSFPVPCFECNHHQKLSSNDLSTYLGQDYICNLITRKQAVRGPPMNPYL
jgi:hypothetical protein